MENRQSPWCRACWVMSRPLQSSLPAVRPHLGLSWASPGPQLGLSREMRDPQLAVLLPSPTVSSFSFCASPPTMPDSFFFFLSFFLFYLSFIFLSLPFFCFLFHCLSLLFLHLFLSLSPSAPPPSSSGFEVMRRRGGLHRATALFPEPPGRRSDPS